MPEPLKAGAKFWAGVRLWLAEIDVEQDRRPFYLYHLIVKHPGEWYYGKDDAYWKAYLDTLAEDPSLSVWKTYTETFITKMGWMKQVPGMVAEPWHMHPVVFLDALIDDDEMSLKWLTVPRGQLTFDAEGNDNENSPWFSRKVHWPGAYQV